MAMASSMPRPSGSSSFRYRKAVYRIPVVSLKILAHAPVWLDFTIAGCPSIVRASGVPSENQIVMFTGWKRGRTIQMSAAR